MQRYRPTNFMLLPTMACQAGCSYCFAKKTGQVMRRETAEQALAFIKRIAPKDQDIRLTFHGGEPLLAGEDFYAWILPLITERFGRRVHLSVQSNLWAVTETMAELFRRYRVQAGTSLDGPEDMCGSQRGTGYYQRTAAGIDLLRAHGMGAGVICTFAAPNAHRAKEVFAAASNPYAIHGAVPAIAGPGDKKASATQDVPNKKAPDGICVDAGQMARVFLDSYEAYRADPAHCRVTTIDAMARGSLEGKGSTCTFFDCLGVFAAVAPDGGIYSCQRFCGMEAYCLGNVSDAPTETDLLNSAAYARLRAVQDGKHAACQECSHWDYCMGGCLYNTLAGGGAKDPYCEAYRAVFDRIGFDMAMEMGAVMLGQEKPTPVLAMAGDQPHPYDRRKRRERMLLAVEKGRVPAMPGAQEGPAPGAFAAQHLRAPYPENDLNKLYLHLTFDCPLQCAHCYAEGGTRRTDELSPERFAAIIREAADRCFRSVVITGGEPLVYAGFDALCAALRETDRKGMKLILRSSFGFPIPPERMRMILDVFDEIVVSVDGDEETHDARRGAGRYRMTVQNLEQAAAFEAAVRRSSVSAGTSGDERPDAVRGKLSLAATLGRAASEGAPGESVRELARRLKVEKVRFRPVLPIGRGAGTLREPWQLCQEELMLSEDFHIRHTCGLGQNLYVEPDGTAYPCYAWCAPDKKLGDLGRESLGALLDRGGLYEYCRHDVDTNAQCRTCEVRYLCGGICKAWVHDREDVDSGDFDCSDRKAYYQCVAEMLQKE